MLVNILIGCMLITVTTFIHATGMVLALGAFRAVHVERWVMKNQLTQAGTVSLLVLLMFFLTFIESSIWALVYYKMGALPNLNDAIYFSAVTYTTLGYGDLVLEGQWRHFSGFEAANGTIMFGWTTALIFTVVQRIYFGPPGYAKLSDSN